MDDKKHQNEPNGGSPESSCPKINNNNNNNNNNGNNNNREQDRFLPIANVGRIMKKVIPGNGKISKDAKETVQECVSEFISFVTGEASDKCQKEKRKTINGDDIIWAITILGFEEYVNPLKLYLAKYRDLEGDHQKLNVPNKQHSQSQHQPQRNPDQLFLAHQQNLPCTSGVYSSATSLMSQSPFVTTDHPFSLPYASTSIQKQLPPQQQQRFDSIGQW